ncbi:MAG: hypothetical protein KY447_06425 [Actinobacteria bacterium]|nr:hypothetical protein [Actinomycetota bacterium]MBW3642534.1 hypothetical protein [Actinomycetota bacterium]
MLLAELEIWHSRPIAPTRRVALGERLLPTDPAPGFGGLLLGGIVAASMEELDPDLVGELDRLVLDLGAGRRVPQPRLRHRFQVDRIGLARSHHRLVAQGDEVEFELEDQGSAAAQILGAVYAAGAVDEAHRHVVMETVRRAMRWRGPVGPSLIAHLSGGGGARGWTTAALAHPHRWALSVLGFADASAPERGEVQRRFRSLLRLAHPDHGGASEGAAERISELAEARRILLAAASELCT